MGVCFLSLCSAFDDGSSEAAGVPHGNPKVVMLGDDPKLGEFREDFKTWWYMKNAFLILKKGYDTDEVAENPQRR